MWLSTFGRQVNTSSGPFAELCAFVSQSSGIESTRYKLFFFRPYSGKEYASADYRWGRADSTVVALEILTVFGAGPICCYVLKQIVQDDPARHYWLIVLSTAELYGGYVGFVTCVYDWSHSFVEGG